MRRRNKSYLEWVKTLPCRNCTNHKGRTIEAHHPKGHMYGSGMGLKSHDDLAVPLCSQCHRMYHDGNIADAKDHQEHWVLATLLIALKQGVINSCPE